MCSVHIASQLVLFLLGRPTTGGSPHPHQCSVTSALEHLCIPTYLLSYRHHRQWKSTQSTPPRRLIQFEKDRFSRSTPSSPPDQMQSRYPDHGVVEVHPIVVDDVPAYVGTRLLTESLHFSILERLGPPRADGCPTDHC